MPRLTCTAPGILPSRCNSELSRRSTNTVSGSFSIPIASCAETVLTRELAWATKSLALFISQLLQQDYRKLLNGGSILGHRTKFVMELALPLAFAGQSGGVLVRALAETAAEASGQANARFAKLIAELVGSGKRISPALLARAVEQVDLRCLRGEGGSLHPKQSHFDTFLPVFPE